jgi:hypothetical protein
MSILVIQVHVIACLYVLDSSDSFEVRAEGVDINQSGVHGPLVHVFHGQELQVRGTELYVLGAGV